MLSTTQTDFRRDSHRSEIHTPTEELFGLPRNDFSIAYRALAEWNHLRLLVRQLTHRAGSGLYVVIRAAALVSRL